MIFILNQYFLIWSNHQKRISHDDAVMKLFNLELCNISQKWAKRECGTGNPELNIFTIQFEDRCLRNNQPSFKQNKWQPRP